MEVISKTTEFTLIQRKSLETLQDSRLKTTNWEEATSLSSSSSGESDEDVDMLVRPMSLLQVCPVDDLAVEDEKKLRRQRKNQIQLFNSKNGRSQSQRKDFQYRQNSQNRRSLDENDCPSIFGVTPPSNSQTTLIHEKVQTIPQDSQVQKPLKSPQVLMQSTQGKAQQSTPYLVRDLHTIRRQYCHQLGISPSHQQLQKSKQFTMNRRKRLGVKVRLNDVVAMEGKNGSGMTGIFHFITGWMDPTSNSSKKGKKNMKRKDSIISNGKSGREEQENSSIAKRIKHRVQFHEEAEQFYIPLHTDYTEQQRNRMWHTRNEFVKMVERNLDEVYDELEEEYEAQCRAEELENDTMAQEEHLQRMVEKKRAENLAASRALEKEKEMQNASSTASNGSIGSTPAKLVICPQKVILTPRAQSSHAIRFKYLKHLGINS